MFFDWTTKSQPWYRWKWEKIFRFFCVICFPLTPKVYRSGNCWSGNCYGCSLYLDSQQSRQVLGKSHADSFNVCVSSYRSTSSIKCRIVLKIVYFVTFNSADALESWSKPRLILPPSRLGRNIAFCYFNYLSRLGPVKWIKLTCGSWEDRKIGDHRWRGTLVIICLQFNTFVRSITIWTRRSACSMTLRWCCLFLEPCNNCITSWLEISVPPWSQ